MRWLSRLSLPIAVFALSLSMFAIGTAEFVIVGLLCRALSSHDRSITTETQSMSQDPTEATT